MNTKFTFTAEQLAEAMLRYLQVRTNSFFFSFRISRSSFVPPQRFEVEMEAEALGEGPIDRCPSPHIVSSGERLTLTRQEVAHALTLHIMVYNPDIPYRGNQISRVPDFIPDRVEVELASLPFGRTIDEYLSHFGDL